MKVATAPFKVNEDILVKRWGEQVKDKPIYDNVKSGKTEYYLVICGSEIVDEFFLVPKENNLINLNISFKNLTRYVGMTMLYLKRDYDKITFAIDENMYGKEKLDFLRNKYKVLEDYINEDGLSTLVVDIKNTNN